MAPDQLIFIVPIVVIIGSMAVAVIKQILASNERRLNMELHARHLASLSAPQSAAPAALPGALDQERLPAEVAHILFLDIVGFSRNSMEEQARQAGELRRAVQGVPEYRRTNARKDVITLDTGDGIALVFFRDPLAPVQCAVEIARAIKGYAGIELRMGVHTGPVSRTADVNGRENVTGSGINTAQRVMACGDPGHILISAASAEVISEFEAWSGCLYGIGEAEAKHGQRIRLYNLVLGEIGNPKPPSALGRHVSLSEDDELQVSTVNLSE